MLYLCLINFIVMRKETIQKLKDNKVIELYTNKKLSLVEISKIVNLNADLIGKYLRENDIHTGNIKSKPNFDLSKAVSLYKSGQKLDDIAKLLNTTRQCLSVWFKRNNVEVFNKNHMKNLRSDVFDKIDNEEKAYWLGFIFADGNISSKGFKFEINLAEKDLSHLQKLKQFLNYERDVRVRKSGQYTICRMSVWNEHLWNSLNNLGCVPNKSSILQFPDKSIFSDESLIKHFIRGYVDGDGCLTYRNKEKTIPEIYILGTSHFLNNMQFFLPLKKLHKIHVKHKDGDQRIFNFVIEGGTATSIASYLYKDASIFLDRKYEKYIEFCRLG